jgi:pimeloyl-ACP methyl ester carboxylesterase
VARLVRDGVTLGYEEAGQGDPPLLFVHGLACHRGFWEPQVRRFAAAHRVVVADLRGHGESDAPWQAYSMGVFADDLDWMCARLELHRPVVVGHSLGGLVALELAAAYKQRPAAAVLVDSVLLLAGDRVRVVHELVTGLRGPDPKAVLRNYFERFFGPDDDPSRTAWILDEAVRTPPHVTSSVWEESIGWDDAEALRRSRVPLLYLDAGTPNADLAQATTLRPDMIVGKTIGSSHFSPLEVPEQVNAMLARFVAMQRSAASRKNRSGGAI